MVWLRKVKNLNWVWGLKSINGIFFAIWSLWTKIKQTFHKNKTFELVSFVAKVFFSFIWAKHHVPFNFVFFSLKALIATMLTLKGTRSITSKTSVLGNLRLLVVLHLRDSFVHFSKRFNNLILNNQDSMS